MTNKDKIIDSWLVIQSKAGNKKSLALLVKRWHKKLCRHAFWYTKDIDAAKDIVQDCWPIIIKKINSLNDNNSFGSWALSIVTRRAIDFLRKKKRENKNLEAYFDNTLIITSESNFNDTEDLKKELRISIKKLSTQSQQILNLFYMEEMTLREIGKIVDLPIGTIKSRLFNAREKLKTIINKKNYEK